MSAGIKYNLNPIEGNMPEMCRFETVYRLSGGFMLDQTNLAGFSKVPPMAPLHIDFKTRKAKVVVCAKVHKKITKNQTALQIEKGSFVTVGMHLGNGTNGGTVEKVDKSNKAYDTVTLKDTPTLEAEVGDVLFEAVAVDGTNPKALANFLNYAWTKVEDGASVTAVGQAYEIKPSKLIVPISEKDKESLGARFMFTY